MKKLLSAIVTLILLTFVSNSSFSAGDEATIKKLSSMYKSGDLTKAIVVPQDTKYAANIKKNILPYINLPAGFSISLFAVVPDARHMAVARNKTTKRG